MRTILNDSSLPRHGTQWVLLTDLSAGECAVVRGVTGPTEQLRDRLRAMGLCEGRRVQVVRPGARLIVTTMGTRIGLDRSLAAGVAVERCANHPVPHNSPPTQAGQHA